LYHQDRIVELSVTGYNRGGVLVEGDGLYGFVPYSHLVEMAAHPEKQNREEGLETYIGRSLRLKVIECAPEDGRVVFSERAALAEPGKRMDLFKTLLSGQTIRGNVTNITDFGVFIDLGGVEGLIHISELSWGRVAHPSQIVKLGQEIDAQVLEISPERCRVALSLKRLLPNPWEKANTDFAVGQVVSAVVTSIVSYGAFARLDAGIEGLIHASEMTLEGGNTVRDVINENQEIQVRILHVDAAHQRMGLSLNLEGTDA
jgi:small subunit ribosomal protein S1